MIIKNKKALLAILIAFAIISAGFIYSYTKMEQYKSDALLCTSYEKTIDDLNSQIKKLKSNSAEKTSNEGYEQVVHNFLSGYYNLETDAPAQTRFDNCQKYITESLSNEIKPLSDDIKEYDNKLSYSSSIDINDIYIGNCTTTDIEIVVAAKISIVINNQKRETNNFIIMSLLNDTDKGWLVKSFDTKILEE